MNTTQILTGIKDWAENKFTQKSSSTEGNLAKFDSNGNPVDAGISAEKVAQKGEIQTYSGNLVDTRSAGTAQEFTYRKSGGDGVNWMRRIKGKSLVWNQLVPHPDFSDGTNTYNVFGNATYAVEDGALVATVTATPGTLQVLKRNIPSISGHKYFVFSRVKSDKDVNNINIYGCGVAVNGGNLVANTISILSGIITATSTSNNTEFNLGLIQTSGMAVGDKVRFYGGYLIDLTLLFGAGNEPSTVAEFEALYPLPYYAYNAGTLISNDAESLETVGFNQWDEEWERGAYNPDTGSKQVNVNTIRSINAIPVTPSTTYYFRDSKPTNSYGNILCYDKAGNYLGRSAGFFANVRGFTTPANCWQIRFYQDSGYGTTYNHDICINLSDAAKNGTYEPYWKKSIQLGLNAFRVTDGTNIITVNVLRSAGDVFDEIDPVRKKYIQRIGEVDLGTLNWVYKTSGSGTGSGAYLYFHAQIPSAAVSYNPICGKYSTIDNNSTAFGNGPDKAVSGRDITGSSTVNIRDSAYSDADTFKAAMNGVPLYYELATPVEYDLVDDIPNAIEVDENGTERAIFPEADDPSAPFCSDSNYSVSTANLVRKLNDAS